MPFRQPLRNHDGLRLTVYECDTGRIRDTIGRATPSTIPHAKEENGIVERENEESTATFGTFYHTMNARIPKHAALLERYTNQILWNNLTRLITRHRSLSERTWTNSCSDKDETT